MFDLKISHWPWSDLGPICAKNVINLSRVRERTLNIVIQCLTMNYDLDLQPTLAKHTHCTTTHHTWHLRRAICKFQGFTIYRAATTDRHTDRPTDGRTVEQTDSVTTELNNRAPHFMGGRDTSNSNENQCTFQNFTKQKRSCSYDTETYDILCVCFG